MAKSIELGDEKIKKYTQRLLMSRLRILTTNGFYGILLMHVKFQIDIECTTAATDGEYIYFGVDFLENLTDSELDFVMMHEILHIALAHCFRGKEFDSNIYNIACDIVINSNIKHSNGDNDKSITLTKYGVSMHKAPNGKEGYLYTAEEVYEMLIQNAKKKKSSASCNCEDQSGKQGGADGFGKTTDDHSKWGKGASSDKQEELEELWKHRVAQAVESIKIRESSTSRGLLPLGAKRLIEELKSSKVNWRELLQKFIQEEICDYSFNPPDRRFDDSPFFLPDFNEVEESVANVLFMIDTSGSMSDKDITLAYSEVKGAIDQFNGKLKGYLGFFDAEVVPPTPFESVEDFLKIKAKGGGGTSFEVIFNYVNKAMVENPPKSIIILTDGYAPFPDEKKANGIPTLWLINNNEINPPWGKIARFID